MSLECLRSRLAEFGAHTSPGRIQPSNQLREVSSMRSDRSLIVSVLLLAAGLGLTFAYCNGTVGLNAGYPLSGASLKLSITTYGPAALGGPALTALGLLLLLWS